MASARFGQNNSTAKRRAESLQKRLGTKEVGSGSREEELCFSSSS